MNSGFRARLKLPRLASVFAVGLAASLSLSGCAIKFDQGKPELPAREPIQVARDSAADLQEAIRVGAEKLAGEANTSDAAKKALTRLAEVSKARLDALGGVWNPWPDAEKFPDMKLPQPKRPKPITSDKEMMEALALCQAQAWADANTIKDNDVARTLASVALGCHFSAADMSSVWGVDNPSWPDVKPSQADPGTGSSGNDKSEYANEPSEAEGIPGSEQKPAGEASPDEKPAEGKDSAGKPSESKDGEAPKDGSYTKEQADAAGKLMTDIDSVRYFLVRYQASHPSEGDQPFYDRALQLEKFTNVLAGAGATDYRQPAYQLLDGLTMDSSASEIWLKTNTEVFAAEFNLVGELNRPEFELRYRLFKVADELRSEGYEFGDLPGLEKK